MFAWNIVYFIFTLEGIVALNFQRITIENFVQDISQITKVKNRGLLWISKNNSYTLLQNQSCDKFFKKTSQTNLTDVASKVLYNTFYISSHESLTTEIAQFREKKIENANLNNTMEDDERIFGTTVINYSLVTEGTELNDDYKIFKTTDGAAIAAGIGLLSAILGYISCVGYRRYMQNKYGNRQFLSGDDVYDTRDLRYFEI